MNRDPKQVSEILEDYFNQCGSVEDALVHEIEQWHPTLQQNFTRFCIQWLKRLAEDGFSFDDRNKASVEFARSIRHQLEKAYLPYI